jgi:hypothetical protein
VEDGHIKTAMLGIMMNKLSSQKDIDKRRMLKVNKNCLTPMTASKAGFHIQGEYFTLSVVHTLHNEKLKILTVYARLFT